MGKVERFEDLNCWKEARELVKEVYIICEKGKLSQDFDTKSQIKRAALSIMNNIAEGFGKYSTKEFIRYLDTAHNSASEVKSIVYVLIDLNYLEETKAKDIQDRTDKVKALSLALIRYLANRTK
jgi:four helix bundle protein